VTPPVESPAAAAAREARVAQEALAAAGERPQPLPPPVRDPLSLCVYATIALLGWIFTPGLVAAVFGFLGLYAYGRAWRAGLRRSDCVLRDPRLVMLYLGLLGTAGLTWTLWRVVRFLAG
jgi:hypothetical protein